MTRWLTLGAKELWEGLWVRMHSPSWFHKMNVHTSPCHWSITQRSPVFNSTQGKHSWSQYTTVLLLLLSFIPVQSWCETIPLWLADVLHLLCTKLMISSNVRWSQWENVHLASTLPTPCSSWSTLNLRKVAKKAVSVFLQAQGVQLSPPLAQQAQKGRGWKLLVNSFLHTEPFKRVSENLAYV